MSEKFNKGLYIALSLLIAILFWLFVDDALGNTIQQTFYDIPIEFVGESDTLPSRDLMLEPGEDTTVDLYLSGPRTVITGLDSSQLRVRVDLTNITAVGTYSLNNYKIIFPEDVQSDAITQDKIRPITVKVEELYSETVPVKVVHTGEVAEGYIFMAEKLAVSPATITVSGREEAVQEVAMARVEMDLGGATSTIHREFSYELLDDEGNVIKNDHLRVSDKRVEICAPVYMVKEMDLLVSFKEQPGSYIKDMDWELQPVKTIQIAGDPASLENKNSIDLGEIDLSTLLGDTDLDLDISLPANTVNLSGINTVSLSVRFKDVETRSFSVTDISPIGLDTNKLKFKQVTNTVDVILRGPAEELEKLQPEDIRIVVDLSEYSPGAYSVPAIVLVDGNDKVGAVGTYSVACKILS